MGSIIVPGRGYFRRSTKTFTFDGSAGKGAVGTFTVFTVTGEVLVVALIPYCSTNIGVDAGAGVASMQLGVANATTLFIATTQADTIDASEFWVSNTPTANGIAVPAGLQNIAITQDIQGEVTSTDVQLVNAGVIRFDIYWLPLSSDGNVVAA